MTSLPFWLQVASVAAAPILGLTGALYGAYRSDRAKRQEWFRERRLTAYTDVLDAMDAVYWHGYQPPSAADELAHMKKTLELLLQVDASLKRMWLIAPDEVNLAARPLQDAILALATATGDVDRTPLVDAVLSTSASFRFALAADVQQPGRRRRHRAIRDAIRDTPNT